MSEKYLQCSMLFTPSIQTTKHWPWPLIPAAQYFVMYMYMCMHCRFVYKGQWREKINSYVDFPTRNLDLNPYLEGPKSIKSSYRLYATSVSFQTESVFLLFYLFGGGGGWGYLVLHFGDWLIIFRMFMQNYSYLKLSSVWGVSSGTIL